MSYADKVFKAMCRDIIDNGEDTKGELVRPTWPDTGEKAYTIKKFGVCNRYDLRKEFPAITLRKTYIKSAFDELLWIWQKKSNNICDLKSHVWDEWADETGSIGKAYGYQIGKRYVHHKLLYLDDYKSMEELKQYPSAKIEVYRKPAGATFAVPFMAKPGSIEEICSQIPFMTTRASDKEVLDEQIIKYNINVYLDQIDSVLWDLKHNPYSRRIMTNIYDLEDLHEMNLYPCAYSMTFNCTKDKETGKLVLNGILNQRSQDTLAANNWNTVQYALLLMMIAQSCDMIPGELVHMISDAHIYDRHVPIVEELISREEYPAPKVWFDPEIKNFYDFKVENLHVEDYETGPQIKDIPIAV